MDSKRVFKTKTFDHWARKVIGDDLICIAALEIGAGLFEADLGHGLCKKRIATPDHGKRGAVSTLVAKQDSSAIIFLVGREKSQPGHDFPATVVSPAKKCSRKASIAKAWPNWSNWH
ncbi:type II toxin-antitoxin system RelE/ParE family toxin [Duganella sp. CF458]|uniref:type II toxin-antitoxin system RelE/ParE family toxin n=1 Tax=Duganella sp. CF458 TaxID=1884368 RepID=UPI000B852DE8|nr:type II toxin-antitoxin system RelE/ParE family toxin [Duganella sp. CF458]